MAFVGSSYTGPVTIATFQLGNDPDTRFGLTLHTNREDTAGLAPILQRFKDDGYSHVKTVEHYMVNGSLVEPGERDWRPAGYGTRSAFRRA